MKDKICTKCLKVFPLTQFHRSKYNPSGYKSHCKKCIKEYQQSAAGKIVSRKAAKKFRNTSHGKSRMREHNQSNKVKQAKKDYKKSPAGKLSEKRYRQSKKGKQTRRKWLESNQDKVKLYGQRAWQKQTPLDKLKSKARHAIGYAVESGRIAKASKHACFYCENKAKHYHHHKGYNKEHWLDVIPVCINCHVDIHS